jgi:L-arabinonolactonase
MQIERVGTVTTGWGESAVWDDQRERLYFVDCAARTLHWLERDATVPETFALQGMPTGVVPAVDGRLVVVMDDGLHVVDPEARTSELLTPYPTEVGGRCNDACADGAGGIVTGKLNLGPDEGAAWRFSFDAGWTVLDPDISNTNGPAVLEGPGGATTLVIGDTSAYYFAYDYDPDAGTVGERRVFGDTSDLDGLPDGSTVDADGGLWCALVGGRQLARFTAAGLDRTVELPVTSPTDVAFGGPGLDRLYVTSIAGDGELDGALLVVDGLGAVGRPEPRVTLP